jgi:hypothetical protein
LFFEFVIPLPAGELASDESADECPRTGSVDEKYPFTLFNIIKIGVPTIILLDGGGYKKTATKWLKDQVNPQRALIGVYNMSEFQALVNKGFLG